MTHGRICYVEIPTTNVNVSAEFYRMVFGWRVRARADGARAFDDATGAVSGSWVPDRTPARELALLTYVMVDDIDATLKAVSMAGGRVMTPGAPFGVHGEVFATFRDPSGNLLGLYQARRS